jgi:succinate dehydrogenase/fumarate reductase cytochrome b subunit
MDNSDSRHLDLLSVFHKILGGFSIVFSLFPLILVGIGIGILRSAAAFSGKGAPPPHFIGWLFVVMGTILIVSGTALSICILLSAKYIAKRKRYRFSFIVACLTCLLFPLGTVLGVFTIITLSKPSVKEMYQIQ